MQKAREVAKGPRAGKPRVVESEMSFTAAQRERPEVSCESLGEP